MHKAILLLILVLSYSLSSFSQNLPLLNQASIGGTFDDFFNKMIPTPNNDGYYVFGHSKSNIPGGNKNCQGYGGFDLWLVKLSHNFTVEWDKCFGTVGDESAGDMLLVDNKIYITGYAPSEISGNKTKTGGGNGDIWMLCLDLDGNILWQECYGGDSGEIVNKLMEGSGNSILISGISASGISGNKTTADIGNGDVWIVEIEKADGAIIRQKTIGSTAGENLAKLYKSPVNTYYLVVTSLFGSSNDKTEDGYGYADTWLMELDADFNILKSKVFGGSSDETKPFIVYDETNIYLACESLSPESGNKSIDNHYLTFNNSVNTWILKLDLDLNIVWDKCYGGYDIESPNNMEFTSNDLILVSTYSRSTPNSGNKTAANYGMADVWTFLLDKDGDIQGEFSYGGTKTDHGIITKMGNEYIFAGMSDSPINAVKVVATKGFTDFWIGKVNLEAILNVHSIPSETAISIYPNPFSTEAFFDLSSINEAVVLNIYTIDGRLVKSEKLVADTEGYLLNLPESNMYMYQIKGQKTNVAGKIIKM